MKPGFNEIHQERKARLSSDRPGQEGGGESTWIAPFIFVPHAGSCPENAAACLPRAPPLVSESNDCCAVECQDQNLPGTTAQSAVESDSRRRGGPAPLGRVRRTHGS